MPRDAPTQADDPSTPTDDAPAGRTAVGLATLLVDPDAFFRSRARAPTFRGPVAVVLLVALLGIAGSVPVVRATTAALPEEAGPLVPLVAATSVIGGLVGVVVAWGLYAVAFHVVSAVVYGARGSFRETLALVGWGFVPSVPEAAISAVVTSLLFAGTSLPSDPVALQAAVRALRADPLFTVAGLLGLVFLAWRAMLWTFAVRHARGLTLRQAGLVVAGPVAVALLVDLVGLLGVF